MTINQELIQTIINENTENGYKASKYEVAAEYVARANSLELIDTFGGEWTRTNKGLARIRKATKNIAKLI